MLIKDCDTISCHIIDYRTTSYIIIQHHAISYNIMQYHTISCYIIRCHRVLYSIMQNYTIMPCGKAWQISVFCQNEAFRIAGLARPPVKSLGWSSLAQATLALCSLAHRLIWVTQVHAGRRFLHSVARQCWFLEKPQPVWSIHGFSMVSAYFTNQWLLGLAIKDANQKIREDCKACEARWNLEFLGPDHDQACQDGHGKEPVVEVMGGYLSTCIFKRWHCKRYCMIQKAFRARFCRSVMGQGAYI